MRTPGLRTRATLVGTLLFAVVIGVGAVLLVSTLQSRLTDSSDRLDRTRVADLLELAAGDGLTQTLHNVDDNAVAQVVGPDGEVLAASDNITGRPAIADLVATPDPQVTTLRAPDDEELETYRIWYASEGGVTAYVGHSTEDIDEATSALRRTLVVGVPAAVLVLALLMWLLLGRVLARLDRIRAEVDQISDTNLDQRVDGAEARDEVGRLARTMNAMLGRLEDSARRQRELVADVSHDLQSPLTGQRAVLELALARPEQTDVETLGREALSATVELERLVGDLLVMASVDADTAPDLALFDLDGLVLEEATRVRTNATVTVDTRAVSAAPARGVAAEVRRVVRNLLENAVGHAGSRVVLTVRVEGDLAVLDVVDDGDGIAPEDRERVFERFVRADATRSRGSGHGLGLAIARGLARRSGGEVTVEDCDGGAHLRLTLPTAH